MTAPTREILLDGDAVSAALERMADEIVAFAGGTDRLVLVGIQRRGAELAERLVARIAATSGAKVPLGVMDITLYRDDLQTIGPRPVVGETHLPHDLDHKVVVIVDDVLFTGRTVRAAMDQLADFGRPSRIGLGVLVDRGGRELPIQADIVGAKVEASPRARVDVLVRERDGRDAVELAEGEEP
jgi:pyrimidine operon attenuation protein/uracil phosphoribosyltransferase